MTIMKMEGMEAFDMKNFMRVYNLVCVCLAGYVVFGVIKHKVNYASGTFVCNDFDITSDIRPIFAPISKKKSLDLVFNNFFKFKIFLSDDPNKNIDKSIPSLRFKLQFIMFLVTF